VAATAIKISCGGQIYRCRCRCRCWRHMGEKNIKTKKMGKKRNAINNRINFSKYNFDTESGHDVDTIYNKDFS
jgi:hypothetical protein